MDNFMMSGPVRSLGGSRAATGASKKRLHTGSSDGFRMRANTASVVRRHDARLAGDCSARFDRPRSAQLLPRYWSQNSRWLDESGPLVWPLFRAALLARHASSVILVSKFELWTPAAIQQVDSRHNNHLSVAWPRRTIWITSFVCSLPDTPRAGE
ncbi:hypothetical protein DENSPDRAFT_111021 [Dentipellis sp. KUC8613]|nr:hypothetical protein DENSPDRAFT_111021 [Dentipellis sp. KUC8613]